MSTLISSAVGGKRTAPKGAPRRRVPPPAPPKPPPKEASPVPEPEAGPETESAAPPSPPLTQQQPLPQAQTPTEASTPALATLPAPAPSLAVEPSAPSSQTPQQVEIQPAVPDENDSAPTQAPESQPVVPTTRASKRKRNAATTDEPAVQPTKRTKRTSARRNVRVQTSVNEGEAAAISSAEPPIDPQLQPDDAQPKAGATGKAKKALAKRKAPTQRKGKAESPATGQAPEVEAQTEGHEDVAVVKRKPAAKKKGRSRKSKKSASTAPEATGQDQDVDPRPNDDAHEEEDDGSDPELHEIDPNTVTVSDMARAKKHGQTSERERKMAEINWDEVVAKRREQEEKALEQAQAEQQQRMQALFGEAPPRKTTEGPNGTAEPPLSSDAQQGEEEEDQTAQPDGEGGVQFKIVNGQIVEDESTLTIPNQAQAQAEADAAATEAVEENDLTVRINNATYLNSRKRDIVERQKPASRNKSDAWSDEETNRFYDALKMFGTDFLIISKMFSGKTRTQIKHKFIREERLDLMRVNNALLGRDTNPTPMNLEHYARETGKEVSDYTKWNTHEEAMASIKEDMREQEAEVRERLAKEAEDRRQQEIAEKERQAARKSKGGKKKGDGKGKKKSGGGGGLGGGGPVEDAGVRVED